MVKLMIRGFISNLVALSLLYIISESLDLQKYALVALFIQWTTYLLHGLPNKSEKFYDLSGSVTNLSLIICSLCSSLNRSPR